MEGGERTLQQFGCLIFGFWNSLVSKANQVRIPLKDPDKSCSELNNNNPSTMKRLKRKFNFTMFDEFFLIFSCFGQLQVHHRTWGVGFVICTTFWLVQVRCCAIFSALGSSRVHHWTWVGFVICTTFWLCISEMLCYYCKTASLKGCQIEKFSPPRTWDATFSNTQKDYGLAINKTTAAGWLLKSSCLQLRYVLCTCTAFFSLCSCNN
jgi:hypothetical protein